uniref:Rieske (2Fe-2S) protein n=1 Tax=Cellvibrio fontiphilus TaxID=1815559 RepID=UPI002B4C13D1|nr:Rieske (2Fe-2S) protein [Cellvibrio fontiphilus]
MPFVALEKLHQLYDGYRKAFTLDGQPLLLLQENGRPVLIKNACPHAGASLTYATASGNNIRCPLHGIEFDLHSGRSANLACTGRLQFIPLVYEANLLGVESTNT